MIKKIKYQSKIVLSLMKINNALKNFRISHNSRAFDYYDNLATPQEQNNYIKNYEEFFYIFDRFIFITKDLLLIARQLEQISIKHHKFLKTNKERIHKDPNNDYSNFIFHLITWFYNSITILIKITEDNIINPQYLRRHFPEMSYVKSVRNIFLQHPELHRPFNDINSTQIPGNPIFIPFGDMVPKGEGWTLLINHYKNKITNKNFLLKLTQEQQGQNKDDFINHSHQWKKGVINPPDILHRIKACGLPDFDQIKLATELESFFSQIILPFMWREYKNAKKNHILFN